MRNSDSRVAVMSYYGDDSWDYPPRRRPSRSPRRDHYESRRSAHYLNPEPGYGAGGLHRSRSHGHAPQPVVNVYNDLYSSQDASLRGDSRSPPYTAAPYPPSPEYRGRDRGRTLGDRLGDELIADELAEMRLDRRRSRSRGRSDAGFMESKPDYYQMELARLEREKRDLERRDDWKREEERIKALDREVRELRKANEILRLASAFFAQAELDRRFKS